MAGYFRDLIERGFLVQTRGHCLGPEGIGQAATFALTGEALNGLPATKDFMKWRKQKPRRKTRHSLAGKSNTGCRKIQPLPIQMSENTTAFAQKPPSTVSENPAIYTSNHILRQNYAQGAGLCGNATSVYDGVKTQDYRC